MKKIVLPIIFVLHLIAPFYLHSQGCSGLKADAGPDQFACKIGQNIQLMGSTSGTVKKYYWTPTTGLSNPNILNPTVNQGPGKYIYTLHVEGVSDNDLIVNGNFEGGNAGFTTEYNYWVPGSPGFQPNWVVVDVNPAQYNSGFPPCPDHTSGSGNQLIVDGSTVAGRKIWCQNVPTVPGKTYLFQFFVQSVFATAPAQLSATADGTTIGSITAGATCSWIEFNACFTATSGSTMMCIQENSGIGFGNDFALDDIAMFEKCDEKDDVCVEIIDIKSILALEKIPKCASDEFGLDGSASSSGPNITYEWSTNAGNFISKNGNKAKAKGTGTYKLKVIYDNGRIHCEDESSVDVSVANDLVATIDVIGMASCMKDTVNMNVLVDNGSGQYIYSWSPANKIISGQGTQNAKVTEPGIYTLKAIDKISGCEVVQQTLLEADTSTPNGIITGDSLINCIAKKIVLTGAPFDTNQYFFTWIEPDKNKISNIVSISSQKIGKYILVVENKQNHCQDSVEWLVNQDTLQAILDLGLNKTIDCINNSATVIPNVMQTNGFEKYQWIINGIPIPVETVLNNKTFTSGSRIILQITNTKNGCATMDSILINDVKRTPKISINPSSTLNCQIKNIQLNAGGSDSTSVNINWNSVGGNIINGKTTLHPNIDKPGWYILRIIDSISLCEVIDSILINQDITTPSSTLGNDFTFTCADTLAIIDGSQSSVGPRLKYIWLSPDGNILSGNGTNTIKVKSSGSYQLIVLDTINLCADTSEIKIIPDQNTPMATAAANDTLDCIINSVMLNGTANSASGNPLKYSWNSPQGNPIQNANGLTPTVNAPGTYILVVIDQVNGCSTTVQTNVIIDTLHPIAKVGPIGLWKCNTNNLFLDASPSTLPKNYKLEWKSTNGKVIADPVSGLLNNAGSPGDYTLSITDLSNGCMASDKLTILADQNKPIPKIDPTDSLTCLIKQLNISAVNSAPQNKIVYKWSTASGNIIGSNTNANIQINKSGYYILEITDTSNQCISIDSIFINENIKTPIIDAGLDQSLNCSKQQTNLNGSIQSNIVNPVILWNSIDGNITGQKNILNPTVDKSGNYVLMITDPTNGCFAIDSVKVLLNTNVPTDISYITKDPNCPGDFGEISIINITGGENPYMIFVDGQKINNQEFDKLSDGQHDLKIIDQNGCDLSKKFDIFPATRPFVDILPSVELAIGENYKLQPTYSVSDDKILWIKWEPSLFLDCDTCKYPTIVNITNELSYTVHFATDKGCEATNSILIKLLGRNFYAPNVISPNGDKLNDRFNIYATNNAAQEVKSMEIYNRWGELIYHGEQFPPNDPEQGWDGKFRGENVLPGVYVYIVELLWKNGETVKFNGDITVIR